MAEFRWLEQALGISLILLILLDVFVTVLYARVGSGIISNRFAHLVARLFSLISRPFSPRRRATILSFSGPAIVVMGLGLWVFVLTCGTALVIHPKLGTSIRGTSGKTPTDFVSALYAGGSSLAIVGSSDFTPQTPLSRLYFLFNSLAGASVLTLTLTYLMQIYTALRDRNALGLNLFLLTRRTGDAAELIAGLGPHGDFSPGYTIVVEIATGMTNAKESHHFYPVLFYFRFPEPYYSVSMSTLIALDTVTLLRSAVDDERNGWLKHSAAVSQLWDASVYLVKILEATFLPGSLSSDSPPADAVVVARWKARYYAAVQRLRRAEIPTISDEDAGAELYVSLRSRWHGHVERLAPALAYTMEEIDPAGTNPRAIPTPSDQEDFRRAA